MLDAQEAVELRALHARAYGRAGALSDAEAARLDELEAVRTSESESKRTEQPRQQVSEQVIATAAAPFAAEESATATSAKSRLVETDADSQGESLATALRRHWTLALAIAVGVAVVGVAAGWLLFSDRGTAPVQLTSAQSTSMFASQAEAEAAATLAEKTGLDSRSIMVAGYDDDVPIWTGIDMSTQRYCLVYDGSMPDPPMVCDDSLMLADADRTLVLEVTGVEDGEITRYEYRFGYGRQYLTVTKGTGVDDAAGE
ncbi:hypothetical protein [Microbacterium sp. LWH13-1.2]|uniref:hypothetical protein n=1 Tax=Microbacterium sp. LWH13-1.2 TaxID=3135260 RepID=UPI003139B399